MKKPERLLRIYFDRYGSDIPAPITTHHFWNENHCFLKLFDGPKEIGTLFKMSGWKQIGSYTYGKERTMFVWIPPAYDLKNSIAVMNRRMGKGD